MKAICVSGDAALIEQIEACAAAAGRPVTVLGSVDDARREWRSAEVVLVGADLAAALACAGLPERARVHLVGTDLASLAGWSVPLQASVLVVPEQSATLSAVLTSRTGGAGEAQIVRVVAGSGGVGASTIAAGLAICAARRGQRVAVVELALAGGGLDLLFGAEDAPGWRWTDLAAASGHVGDLAGRLPSAGGVDIVSSGREWVRPRPGAVQAVLGSLTRSHDLVVIDAGRGEDPSGSQFRRATTLVVVAAEVRAVMAARAVVDLASVHDAKVVVRQGRGRRLGVDEVAAAMQMTADGRVRDDASVVTACEAGEAPARSSRRGLARDVGRVLDAVLVPPAESSGAPSRSRADEAPTSRGLALVTRPGENAAPDEPAAPPPTREQRLLATPRRLA